MNNTISQPQTRLKFIGTNLLPMKTFLIVWIGQVISLLGSSMTGFALGVWIFQQTGSVFSFALTLLFNMLPKALISPYAGVLADRLDRRRIMMLTDLVAGIATITAAFLYISGGLSTWHIYLLTAVNAGASAFQNPAFSASVTQLVPKTQYGRANGLIQLGQGLGQVIAPVMAGTLIGILGLGSVLVIDLLTFLIAILTLFAIRFTVTPAGTETSLKRDDTWFAELNQAIGYLSARPGLLGLMLAFTLVNFFVGTAEAVLTPMVLSFTTPDKLGLILTTGGVGMLFGSVAMTVYGGGRRKAYAAFGAYTLMGFAVLTAGLKQSVLLISVAVFMAFFALPTVMGASQAIFQVKVSPKIQGRVFGLRIFLNTISFALAYLAGGYLAEALFEPAMGVGGLLADMVGRFLGIGPGRGIGLMFVLMGFLAIVSALGAFAHPRIRRVEIELPDN
ncbi:MAG: MFS transporter [Anaerolineales bacterium]